MGVYRAIVKYVHVYDGDNMQEAIEAFVRGIADYLKYSQLSPLTKVGFLEASQARPHPSGAPVIEAIIVDAGKGGHELVGTLIGVTDEQFNEFGPNNDQVRRSAALSRLLVEFLLNESEETAMATITQTAAAYVVRALPEEAWESTIDTFSNLAKAGFEIYKRVYRSQQEEERVTPESKPPEEERTSGEDRPETTPGEGAGTPSPDAQKSTGETPTE